jgi:hypothetical protein
VSGAVPRIKGKRRVLDAYYTPDSWASSLVGLLPIKAGDTALEPHAGGGAFVRAMNAAGALVSASDMNPDARGLSQARGRTQVGDFLDTSWDPDPLWVVGNPPYRGAGRQVLHALRTSSRHVAMLLRLGFLAGKTRRASIWDRHPPRCVWVLSQRPSFTGGGTDASEYGWFWWDKAYQGEPRIDWFQPTGRQPQLLASRKLGVKR